MKIARLLLTVCFAMSIYGFTYAQEVSILSWNIAHLGKTKSPEEIEFMCSIMQGYDIIAIQEVVANDPAGARAVAQISDILNRSGSKWDYKVSHPTTGTSQQKERYAFIWNTAIVKINGRPWLDESLADIVCREPYLARFNMGEQSFLIANYHSIPHSKKPQWENKQVLQLPMLYPNDKILIAGDYNISSTDKFWDLLNDQHLQLTPFGDKSTLRRACTSNNDFTYSNHAIDFFIYEKAELNVVKSSVIDYVGKCEHLNFARSISDHLPVFCTFKIPGH